MMVDSFFHESTISLSIEEIPGLEPNIIKECPLKRWTDYVESLTCLKKSDHIKNVYIALTEKLRRQEINSDSDRYEFLNI